MQHLWLYCGERKKLVRLSANISRGRGVFTISEWEIYLIDLHNYASVWLKV